MPKLKSSAQNHSILFSTIKRLLLPFALVSVIYLVSLGASIHIVNGDTAINYLIEPYIYGSGPIDFFLPLIVSAAFSWNLYFLRKDHFLTYVHPRIEKNKYIGVQILAALLLSFLMVAVVNFLAVGFSTLIASPAPYSVNPNGLNGYLFSHLQMNHPLLFGFFWSIYKGLMASLICLLGQVWGLYSHNLYLILLGPFVTVFLENLLFALLNIPEYSFPTTYILNRLETKAMTIPNLLLAIVIFCFIIFLTHYLLRRKHESAISI